MAADRGAYICQSQSLNVFLQDANFSKLSSMHFYAWKKGLKTGMYYLRTKAAVDAIKFTVDSAYLQKSGAQDGVSGVTALTAEEIAAQVSCSLDNPEGCISCGS